MVVSNGPEEIDNTFVSADFLPKGASFGKHLVRLSKNVLFKKGDVEGVEVGKEIVLMHWGVMKLPRSKQDWRVNMFQMEVLRKQNVS